MQAICRRIGMAVGTLLLMGVIVGCGGKPPDQQTTKATSSPKVGSPTETGPMAPVTTPRATKAAPRAVKPTARRPVKSAPEVGSPEDAGEAPEGGKLFLREADPEESNERDSVANKDLPYTVVKVYYATDRSQIDVLQWREALRGGWPVLTVVFALITIALMLVRRRASRIVRGLSWVLLVFTVILAGLTVAYRCQPEFAREKISRMYGGGRGELELGTCDVSIPRDHEVGELESPNVLFVEFRQDPERHIVLLGVRAESPADFYADLRKCIDKTDRKEAFVFIHGYNVGFETAVRRTAQIAYDLKFEGAPITYSWPSEEGLFSYTVDETNVAWTVPHLKQFLQDIAQRSGATSVHLVAHSMGNRALTSALREMAMEQKDKCPRFHEVVLTAPDVDADVFRRDIAPAIVNTADRVTLYASSNDKALIASRKVHGYLRAGESGDAMLVIPGIDTVDVSDVDTSFIGHSYYGSSTTVLADLFELMQGSKPPDQRKWLQSMRLGAQKYWKFLKAKIHDAPPGEEL